MKSRLGARRLVWTPDLSLADTEQIFFVLLIDFDFPTIEVGLEHLNHIGIRIGDQQVSGLAIEPMPVSVIGQRGDDDQAEGPTLSAATPENWADGLVTQLMRTAGSKDRGSLPGDGVIFAHLFRRAQIFTVRTSSSPARLSFRQSRQMNVFAGSSDQDGAFGQPTQHREIAIAGIDNDPQDTLGEIGHGVQTRTDLLNQEGTLSTEALLAAHLVILFPFGIWRFLAHLLHIGVGLVVRVGGCRFWCSFLFRLRYRWRQIEGNRNRARRADAVDRADQ